MLLLLLLHVWIGTASSSISNVKLYILKPKFTSSAIFLERASFLHSGKQSSALQATNTNFDADRDLQKISVLYGSCSAVTTSNLAKLLISAFITKAINPSTALLLSDVNILTAIHTYLLYSASIRKRLDATTFKILTVSVLSSMAMNALRIAWPFHGLPLCTRIFEIGSLQSILGIIASSFALRMIGLPNFGKIVSTSLSGKIPLAKAYLVL